MKITAIATAAGVLAGAYLGFSSLVYHEIFERNAKLPAKINEDAKKKDTNAPKRQDERSEWMHKQIFTDYTIKNDRNEMLCAHYLAAQNESKTFVLCSHGYRSRGKGEFRFISKFYHENGYNILLVDHTASGDSEGSNISFGYHESRDLLLWVNFLTQKFGTDINIILHGISMGCATVLLLAGSGKLPENVKFIIADCGYASVRGQFESVLKSINVPAHPLLETVSAINRIKHGFSLSDISPIEAVIKIKIPVLFIHGKRDTFVPASMTKAMYETCTSEKDILLVENAGHAQSYQKNSAAYEEKIIKFTEKYIGGKKDA